MSQHVESFFSAKLEDSLLPYFFLHLTWSQAAPRICDTPNLLPKSTRHTFETYLAKCMGEESIIKRFTLKQQSVWAVAVESLRVDKWTCLNYATILNQMSSIQLSFLGSNSKCAKTWLHYFYQLTFPMTQVDSMDFPTKRRFHALRILISSCSFKIRLTTDHFLHHIFTMKSYKRGNSLYIFANEGEREQCEHSYRRSHFPT